MQTAIIWFRNDLRLRDNTALHAAATQATQVIPVHIEDDLLPPLNPFQKAFQAASLAHLKDRLRDRGLPLQLLKGSPNLVLLQLCRKTKAQAVFCNKQYEPDLIQRDEVCFRSLNEAGIGFLTFKDAVIWEEMEICTQAGSPYTVFTPYARNWRTKKLPSPLPELFHSNRISNKSQPSSKLELDSDILPGEDGAELMMERFIGESLDRYHQTRDFPAAHGTSRLATALHFGTLGIRTLLAHINQASVKKKDADREGLEVYVNELIWREFYYQILANFPQTASRGFRSEYDNLSWSDNQSHFQAWKDGLTGYPIVDAAMRCLTQTGWMHNRLRMITAMFLTKDLMIHWQWGEQHFRQTLLDFDLAANNGGWQWSAGTGTDAAPYFRIFNPTTQGEKFDPEGVFIRQWLPELSTVPQKWIHCPSLWPEFKSSKYPRPIVDHNVQRQACLAMFKKVKNPI